MTRATQRLSFVLFGVLAAICVALPANSQTRDVTTNRLVLDDDGAGGTFNRLAITTGGDIPTDRILTIQDPGRDSAEFLLAVPDGSGGFTLSPDVNIGVSGGVLNVAEIETPNADETLRLNPSGDLVQVGNSASPSTSNGLAVYGDVVMNGPDLTLESSTGIAELNINQHDIEMIVETVTINGNLVVNGNLTVNGRLRANSNGNQIGSGSNAEQLRINGSNTGSGNHLYVVGNIRLTNELRIGSGNNTSVFKTGTQAGQITYTLPTALPAVAGTGGSMGNGVMQTTNTGTMSWRNTGTASAALNFPSTADGATSDLTVTVTGAADGDLVVLGIPNGAQPAGGAWYQAWVSAANTVTVRLFNETGAAVDPASDTFNVMVMRP